jgi:hypothetical protein
LVEDLEFFEELGSMTEAETKQLEAIRKYEKVVENKNSKLLAPGKSFQFVMDIMQRPYNEAENRRLRQGYIGNSNNVISKILALNAKDPNSQQRVKPVILVPNEVIIGNLNMENALPFIVEGKYQVVDRNTFIKVHSNEFTMELLDEKVTFEVTDDVTTLKNKGKMGQVVAIFIKGDSHQFKDIKDVWGTPQIAKLFSKVRSYFLTFADVATHPEVQKWNVKILKIDRFARHKDLVVQQDFLGDLKSFLLSTD